ncbi:6042_t:CDS:2, partial [Dentiscutata erythropus]
VAPRAKMNEQRSRRFKAICVGFDTNSVTPGTTFMDNFSSYFKEFIHNKIKNDDTWKCVKIIYSGHDVPGEGEHKIMKYIHNSESKSDCIYGRDSDLILLGLLHYKPNLKILSSNEFFLPGTNLNPSKTFELKFLGTLRKKLTEEFFKLWEPKQLSFEFKIESIIKDFNLLVLFMGNDFIPMLPNINEGLDFIIPTYKEMLKESGGYINDAGNLNVRRLEKIFEKLSIREKELFNPNKLIEAESENEEFLRWKQKYYRNKKMIKDGQDQKNLVKSYIEGLQWVLSYYEGEINSYRWFYPEHHSPLISDLETIKIKNFESEDYYKPFEQLMFVLPPRSKELLPFYTIDESKTDKLPFINEQALLSVLKSVENKLTSEERQRNVFKDAIIFEYDNSSKEAKMSA